MDFFLTNNEAKQNLSRLDCAVTGRKCKRIANYRTNAKLFKSLKNGSKKEDR